MLVIETPNSYILISTKGKWRPATYIHMDIWPERTAIMPWQGCACYCRLKQYRNSTVDTDKKKKLSFVKFQEIITLIGENQETTVAWNLTRDTYHWTVKNKLHGQNWICPSYNEEAEMWAEPKKWKYSLQW